MSYGADAVGPGERPSGEAVSGLRPVDQRPEPPTNVLAVPASGTSPAAGETTRIEFPRPQTYAVSEPEVRMVPAPALPQRRPEADKFETPAAEPVTSGPVTPDEPREPVTVTMEAPAAATQPTEAEPATVPPVRSEPVWPGLTAAGLPTRVPRELDEESIKEEFARSWEAAPTSPTPLTRKPFTPTYLGEPPRPRPAWEDLAPEVSTGAQPTARQPDGAEPSEPPQPVEPPEPKEPPQPKEPPRPVEPPEPKEPPAPPTPPSPPSPFPSPTPVPTPPQPVPTPVPPSPVPTPPPGPPVPNPPPPFPPPPSPVPPPPSITMPAVPVPAVVPGRPAPTSYQGGTYSELATEPITTTGTVIRDRAPERVSSVTGQWHSQQMLQRRERRRKAKTVAWVSSILLVFAIAIAVIVILLAGDFLGGLFDTFSRWAG